MGGLWKKLDHEKSLRRDKAKKEDYAQTFGQPASPPPEPKRPFSLRLTNDGSVTVRKSKAWTGDILRERALKALRRGLSGAFVVSGYKFSYAWTPEKFAEANGVELGEAKGLQMKLREAIKQKRQFAERRIMRAQIEDGYVTDEATGMRQRVHQLSYDVSDLFEFLD